MNEVPITRAAHVIEICDILREIGTPVTRELANAKLPATLEETPDALVNALYGMEFAKVCADKEGIEDFGWLTAKHFCRSQLNSELIGALQSEPTVKTRLEKLFELSALEDSHYRPCFGRNSDHVVVFADGGSAADFIGYDISEWVQIAVVLEPIRSIMGRVWCPDDVYFTSNFRMSDEARQSFPNTRFHMNASRTAISFPNHVLAASTNATGLGCAPQADLKPVPTSFSDVLQALMMPYLSENRMPIGEAADLMGTSTRGLQRKLADQGLRYSQLIETARFEMATELLKDPEIRLIDVAFAVGYEDQSNLGRCFRRMAGVSPGKYRNMQQAEVVS